MFKKISNSITAHFLLLGAFTLILFREIFSMEFWKDDYTLLYRIQQKAQVLFAYPYQHFVRMHDFLYDAFKLEPLGYFIVGLFIFFISAVIFYFLVYDLFSKKSLAFIASLIYITSPLGVDCVFMMTTFATGYLINVLFLITLLFLFRYFKTKKFVYYCVSLVSLIILCEFLPHRTFYLPFIVMLFELVNFKMQKISSKKLLLRLIVLLSIFVYFFYLSPTFVYPAPARNHLGNLTSVFRGIVNWRLVFNPLFTVTNMIYAGFAYLIYHNFFINNSLFRSAILIFTLLFLGYLFIKFRKREAKFSRIFLFSVGYLYLTPLAFYPFSQREISVASFRYLACGLPAFALFAVCVYLFLLKLYKNKTTLFRFLPQFIVMLVIIINAYSTRDYLKNFNSRSYYTRQFNSQFKDYVPQLPKNSIIYFDLDRDANINYRLIDSYRVGVYDERAYFAVRYNLKVEDLIPIIVDYKQLVKFIKNDPQAIERVFAFAYRENGLINLIDETRSALTQVVKYPDN